MDDEIFSPNLVTFSTLLIYLNVEYEKLSLCIFQLVISMKVFVPQVDAACPHCFLCFCVWQEGKQAALAADFSVTQFKHLGRLLMVHGRNSYKRSAALSQFVIHRSLCISAMQVNQTRCH